MEYYNFTSHENWSKQWCCEYAKLVWYKYGISWCDIAGDMTELKSMKPKTKKPKTKKPNVWNQISKRVGANYILKKESHNVSYTPKSNKIMLHFLHWRSLVLTILMKMAPTL